MACPAELPKCWTGSRETCALPPPVSFGFSAFVLGAGEEARNGAQALPG